MKIKLLYFILILLVVFSGCEKDPDVPEQVLAITTSSITNIKASSAACGGEIPNIPGMLPITARGVCWSTSQNPTVSDAHTTDGSGTGSFTSSITGLTLGITYYVRAYATNSKGTSYGEERSFTTSSLVYVTTNYATQTGSEYSSYGFQYNGVWNDYNYKLLWSSNCSFSNTQYADTIGIILNGWQKWYWTSFSDGIKTWSWTSWSNTSSTTVTYQAYAVKTDGTYVYGQEKSIHLYYGGKNSTTQKVEFDIDVNKMSKNRVVTAKSTSNMNEIRTK